MLESCKGGNEQRTKVDPVLPFLSSNYPMVWRLENKIEVQETIKSLVAFPMKEKEFLFRGLKKFVK